jgi:threonine/homoserine/homoserine lactone efflux protein
MFEALLKGLTLGLLLSISVGPVIFSILKQSLNNGHKGGLAFIIGVSLSDIGLVLVSNVFTELFASLNTHREVIGITGSVFLITVGIYFLFFKKVKVDEGGKQVFKFRKRDYLKITASGFFMNTLNPAVFIFWLTTSTAIIAHTVNQRIIIFITCLSFVLLTDFAKVMLAGKIRERLTPHNIHIINRVNGIILICFGLILLWGLIYYSHKISG